MDIQDNKATETNSPRRRLLLLAAILIAAIITVLLFTSEKTRELGERLISPIDLLPLPEIPDIYDIQGYPAASERLFSRFLKQEDNNILFSKLKNFLRINQVDQVVPPFELLRQGSDWQDLDEPPFAIPPVGNWGTMVYTLRAVQREIVPIIGPVTVVSGWRTTSYNSKAGGSRGSKHLHFCGLDIVPQKKFSREQLVPVLKNIHKYNGQQWNMGLGIYKGIRFHVDTCGYRRW
ncbi:D-Ala-D-Ala carboxypeptidase family metallohydrolase [Microbulbifer sp. MLAF003]|uniref:D-Ala-D-Ala carboxypeptidase family metallohydrolase n=1 Tax=unclassified Microbulbifer TaxID=2619833 RepID=UPI0024ADD6DE|nr:D-Ala-D-Ala carboxypeptidase family metallohydrolase [Microbulbifer sp. MLAF003]WHI51472.1 D-Ala-D-Ala carboxypeptidase family metallohydrolase [Microbulbifer sp. MLAF003]